MNKILLICFVSMLFSCKEDSKVIEDKKQSQTKSIISDSTKKDVNTFANIEVTSKIFEAEEGTFGYDILVEKRAIIHQPSIPALPGNLGFSTRTKAQIVADYIVNKFKTGEMPPTITIEELKKLNAL
jgi:Domain of unknown function (DUF4907)